MTTAAANATHARGILEELVPATATRPAHMVLAIPGTSYRLHLRYAETPSTAVGKRIAGVIRCDARRVDRIESGGRFVEPVYGRPRRIAGTVLACDAASNCIVVDAGGASTPGAEMGLPIVCRLTDPRQKAADFAWPQMVVFDVCEGATFEQA